MKKSTAIATVFLIIAIIFCGILFVQLGSVQNRLTTTQTELTGTKTQLAETQTQLADSETKLKTTAEQLTTTKSQLDKTKSQLTDTQTQLSTAKNENTQMLSRYTELKDAINLRLGRGENSEKFVTPNDPQVAALVAQIAGSYSTNVDELWRDYRRMYDWVTKNIEYSYDSYLPVMPDTLDGSLRWTDDCWRTPAETIKDKHGDCEDMAALLASLMLSYNKEQFGVWGVIIQNENQGHVAVALPVVGDKLVIFDPAGNYYSGYQSGYAQSYSTSQTIRDWLDSWADKIPGAHVCAAFSYDLRKDFTSTQEFINWANEPPD
jgi:uncharacterized membrane-anchored protein YhcB (DUF1043 family)